MSWTRDFTKEQKRELSRVVGLAYDRELSKALTALDEYFRRWKAGEIGPHDLSDAIHTFHQGPSRQLWLRYSDGDHLMALVYAIRNGILAGQEVPTDLLELLKIDRPVNG